MKALWFITKIGLLAFLLLLSFGLSGEIKIDAFGYLLTAPTNYLLIGVILGFTALYLVIRSFDTLFSLPSLYRKWRKSRTQEQTIQTLTSGFIALASGNDKAALKAASKAQKLLKNSSLSLLMNAEANQIAGQKEDARGFYREMLNSPDLHYLGAQGLIKDALENQDYMKALDYARKAYKLDQKSYWVFHILLDLECKFGHWQRALDIVKAEQKLKKIGKDQAQLYTSILSLELAKTRAGSSDKSEQKAAFALTEKALKDNADFTPAILLYTELAQKLGKQSSALKLITKSWSNHPHPDLIAAYKMLERDDHSPSLIKHLLALVNGGPECAEGHFAMAEAYLSASLWGLAREHLNKCIELGPTKKVYELFAQLERKEYQNERAATLWLEKALDAAEEQAWVCNKCHAFHDLWNSVCTNCHSFASLDWKFKPEPSAAYLEPSRLMKSAS